NGPPPRLAWRRPVVRAAAMVLVGAALAALLGGGLPAMALCGSATLLMVIGERRAGSAAAGRLLQVATSAARVEGQRDAIAQVMSLELAHERTRSVLEALREGVVVVDEVGEVVLANPAARRAMPQPNVEPVGRALWELLHDELAGRAREAFDALGDEGPDGGGVPEIRYSAIPCGDRVYDLTAVRATSRRTGQDFGTVFLLVDVTRTHELARIKDRFLSSVSHELRTPLTNICASSEILSQLPPADSAEWPEFARVIHQESVELADLVDSLFDYLQLESGEARFDDEDFDGGEVVRHVVAAAEPRAHARGTTVEVQIDEPLPTMHADRRRFEQVVRQLVDNAIKFGPDRGRVVVAVAAQDAGLELRVEDQGPGVPAGERQAVFEKFSQLRDHLTDKPDGTGIGLASSRAIVARFGGLIWCEDGALGGACFVVLVPGKGMPRLAGFAAGTGAGGGF
ncbi:MAG: HAMP domain-containing histidine kinase, partial [Planctomycetes bacterium]|nr:HAMP domain-containing histidine kinase [Planctomycetota bacterium]